MSKPAAALSYIASVWNQGPCKANARIGILPRASPRFTALLSASTEFSGPVGSTA